MHALSAATLIAALCAIATLSSGAAGVAQPPAERSDIDLVEIDVTAVDKRGAPVHGLTKKDFVVKEDGRAVPIVTFSEVAAGQEGPVDGRSIVMLLDDTGVPVVGTSAVQTIARTIVEFSDRHDRVSVVRLSREQDEAFGDLLDAGTRIGNYRAGVQPFIPFTTPAFAVSRFAAISRDLLVSAGRKILVCIGSPGVCNIVEPAKTAPVRLYERWVEVLTATARANAAVYAVVPGTYRMRGGGLVESSGGEFFASSYDVGPAIRRVLQDASNYYLLGYWPAQEAKPRDLHSIEVKALKSGVKVRARRQRGN
jgi:VWFA-related protein